MSYEHLAEDQFLSAGIKTPVRISIDVPKLGKTDKTAC
jgi:hypothetical protein